MSTSTKTKGDRGLAWTCGQTEQSKWKLRTNMTVRERKEKKRKTLKIDTNEKFRNELWEWIYRRNKKLFEIDFYLRHESGVCESCRQYTHWSLYCSAMLSIDVQEVYATIYGNLPSISENMKTNSILHVLFLNNVIRIEIESAHGSHIHGSSRKIVVYSAIRCFEKKICL